MRSIGLRIGELARQAGVSVRTLHYYDEIGLLSPRQRSEAGYRLYGEAEIVRLQQIRSLQELGFPLGEIGELLDRPGGSMLPVIELHLRRLREQIELQQALRARLEAIATRLAAADDVSAGEFLKTMELMTMIDKAKTYYTAEQLEALAQRRQELGEEAIRQVEAEWPRLIAQMRAEMEQGTDPANDRVQQLARRWQELVSAFTGGDPGIAESLHTMYENEPGMRQQVGIDGELSAYVGKALSSLSG